VEWCISISLPPTDVSIFSGTDYLKTNIPWYNQVDIYGQQYFQLILTQGLRHNWNLNAVAFATLGGGYYEEYKVNDALSNYNIANAPFTDANYCCVTSG
jgi:iron complex outermembrane receptor protein